MAWYDKFLGRNAENLEEKLNPAQPYFDHKTESSREFTVRYERAYEDPRIKDDSFYPICCIEEDFVVLPAIKIFIGPRLVKTRTFFVL